MQHNSNIELQEICKARCRADVKYFINEWVWTYDPREEVSNIPFIMYPLQEDFIDWLSAVERDKKSAVADKSRDMGFTWLCAAYFVHRWLFRKGFAGGIGSRKQDYVDKIGDPDSIFEKIRIILRNLPGWMLPNGYDSRQHDSYMRIANPENGSIISGEAGDSIGRGGRKTMYLVDEAAWLQRPQLVDMSLSNNTNVIIYVSTPNGPGNPFAHKRFSGAYRTFTMHWLNDPRKAKWVVYNGDGTVKMAGCGSTIPVDENGNRLNAVYPWYEEMKAKFDPVTIAQEVDIDYNASIEGVVCPGRWVRAAVMLGKSGVMSSEEPVAGFDVAAEGSNENVIIVRRGFLVRQGDIKSWSYTDTFVTAKKAIQFLQLSKVRKVNFDGDGIGASVAGSWAHEKSLGFEWYGLRNQWKPTNRKWDNGKTSAQMFINLRAEMWFTIRRRLEKTFEHIEYGVEYPLDEMIALPEDGDLEKQLSMPLYEKTESGKIKVESKETMRARGVKSPDKADALIMAFAPHLKKSNTNGTSYSEETFRC